MQRSVSTETLGKTLHYFPTIFHTWKENYSFTIQVLPIAIYLPQNALNIFPQRAFFWSKFRFYFSKTQAPRPKEIGLSKKEACQFYACSFFLKMSHQKLKIFRENLNKTPDDHWDIFRHPTSLTTPFMKKILFYMCFISHLLLFPNF